MLTAKISGLSSLKQKQQSASRAKSTKHNHNHRNNRLYTASHRPGHRKQASPQILRKRNKSLTTVFPQAYALPVEYNNNPPHTARRSTLCSHVNFALIFATLQT